MVSRWGARPPYHTPQKVRTHSCFAPGFIRWQSEPARLRDGQSVMADESCACFSLCHPEEVRSFFIRLPIVTSAASPWYEYLRAVYHTPSVPLPFDLRTLGAFYLPLHAEQFGQVSIPWGGTRCNRTTGRSTARRCAASVCRAWLNLSEAREAQAREWERDPISHPLGARVMSWKPASVKRDPNVLWHAGGLPLKAWSFAPVPATPFSHEAQLTEVTLMGDINSASAARRTRMEPYILLRFAAAAEQRAPPSEAPFEVLRNAYPGAPDGVLYGCWLTALLEPFPRGTGIALHAGRTLSFVSKAAAKHWARRGNGTHCSWHWEAVPPDLLRRARVAPPAPGADPRGTVLQRVVDFGDNSLAACARETGYDSVLMQSGASSRPELLLATPECTWPGQVRPLAVCTPPETALRTGWWAERRCVCARTAPEISCPGTGVGPLAGGLAAANPGPGVRNRSLEVLNCGGFPLCPPTLHSVTHVVRRIRAGSRHSGLHLQKQSGLPRGRAFLISRSVGARPPPLRALGPLV